ncbi:unnamed protein product (macronuclear) [Paramecium tetraurelia]|uniref:Uncharacterized protein n=1 Tax=Paramecium tetraurelia TaxID=5888 RepID=A0BRS1_PARTE|nr:uncharacterized protein GSPATT00031469001 [Paramecium tetraurelia]CAK61238.1 unnamed protein product [Paramecium tetraurelia]|eukprot:XP_001428636.1 hypothetical protein (macronuclear) [Paramecium tetraurelia strain d4-2]
MEVYLIKIVLNRQKQQQQLPEDNNDLKVKASVFEKSLNKFIIHIARKYSWNPILEEYDDALEIKKMAVMLMIKTQESEQQRTLDQWNKNISLIREVERCKCVINLFGFLGLHIKNNNAPLKPDEESQKKEKAQLQLIGNFDSNLRYFFMKQYNDGKLQKLQGAMNEEKKKLLLESINNFLKNNDVAKLRAILAKFKRNSKFFSKLFATKFGGAIVAFQKWKNLPDLKIQNNQKMQGSLKGYQIYILEEDLRQLQNHQNMCIKKVIYLKFYLLHLYYFQLQQKIILPQKNTGSWHGPKQKIILILERYKQIAQINRNLQIYCKSILNSSSHISRTCLKDIQTQQKIRKCLEQNVNDKMGISPLEKFSEVIQIYSQLDDEKKKLLVFALHRNLRTNDQGRLRDILRKFYLKRQKQAEQKKYISNYFIYRQGKQKFPSKNGKLYPKIKNQIHQKQAYSKNHQIYSKFTCLERIPSINYKILILMDRQDKNLLQIKCCLLHECQKKSFLKWQKIVEFHRVVDAFNISDKKKLAIQLFYQHKMNQLNVAQVEWKRLQSNLTNKKESAQEGEIRLNREAILLFQNFGKIKLRIYFQKMEYESCQEEYGLKQDRELMKEALDIWKGPKLYNKLFQRVAEMIAKNTNITPQIAFWRMRDISTTSKAASLNSLQIVKCKKLINNLLKAYDRVRQRAITNIEHYGRGITDTSSFQPSHSSFLQQTPVRDSLGKSQMESILLKNSQYLANQSDHELLKKMNELIEENSRLRDQGTFEESMNSKDQQINEQQRLIQDLNTRLDRLRGQGIYIQRQYYYRIIKSLEEYEDHLVEDGFITIKVQKRD